MHDARVELARRATERSFEAFFRAFPPRPDYRYGRHTLALLEALERTTFALEGGHCVYLAVCIPPRHGKSDAVSRRWPAWHLLRNREDEIILSSYNYELASSMSYDVRRLTRDVGQLYGMNLSGDREALSSWRLMEGGAIHAAGIGGTITGRGAHLLIIDDYFKNREEAESETIRSKRWESLESDLLTRLAPVHAVVIVANRWHEDDIIGRIERKNDPGHEDYDEDFPQFEVVRFPAWSEAGGWLFPERFSEHWYRTQRAFMGTYAWNAQGLQEPRPRTGNLLRADLVQIVDESTLPAGLLWRRGWDLASTEKERTASDPDFTVGTLAAYDSKRDWLYIKDVQRGQWSTLKRDERMVETALKDGRGIRVMIEVVAGYKDAYNYIRKKLLGKAVVRKTTPDQDKVVRAIPLESLFEAGRVSIVKGPWNRRWIDEFLAFPGGKHDDQVDSLVVAIHGDISGRGRAKIERVSNAKVA